jgi:hypothetical protein
LDFLHLKCRKVTKTFGRFKPPYRESMSLVRIMWSIYVDGIFVRGFIPRILKPTRITHSSATFIDHILTNDIDSLSSSGIIINDVADHFAVYYNSSKKFQSTNNNITHLRSFSNSNHALNLCISHPYLLTILLMNHSLNSLNYINYHLIQHFRSERSLLRASISNVNHGCPVGYLTHRAWGENYTLKNSRNLPKIIFWPTKIMCQYIINSNVKLKELKTEVLKKNLKI